MGRRIAALLLLLASARAERANATAPAVVAAYLPEWRYEGANWVDISKVVNQLILFSLEVAPSGRLTALDRLPRAELLAEARAATSATGCRLLVCIGGNGRSAGFSRAVAKRESRALFVQQLVELCEKHGLDGVDLNWEYPGYDFRTGYASDAVLQRDYRGLGALVKKLHAALAPSGRIVTMAYYPDKKQEPLLREHGLLEWAHNLHMMAYDQPGRHSTWEFARSVAQQASQMLPPSLVTLGLPFYGRHVRSGEWRSYEDLVREHAPLGPSENEAGGYFFNGPELIERKVKLALELGLGGVMVWEVGQDCRQNLVAHGDSRHEVTCPDGESSALLTAIRRGLVQLDRGAEEGGQLPAARAKEEL